MKFYVLALDYDIKKYYTFQRKDWISQIGLNNLSEVIRGGIESKIVLEYQKSYGSIFSLIHGSGLLSPIICHCKIISNLELNKITGWFTTKVILEINQKEINHDYSRVFITGKVGPILYDRMPIVESEERVGKYTIKQKHKVGILFDESTWDGSDFFMSIDKSGYVFITEKVKNIIESENIENIIITPIKEMKVYAG